MGLSLQCTVGTSMGLLWCSVNIFKEYKTATPPPPLPRLINTEKISNGKKKRISSSNRIVIKALYEHWKSCSCLCACPARHKHQLGFYTEAVAKKDGNSVPSLRHIQKAVARHSTYFHLYCTGTKELILVAPSVLVLMGCVFLPNSVIMPFSHEYMYRMCLLPFL